MSVLTLVSFLLCSVHVYGQTDQYVQVSTKNSANFRIEEVTNPGGETKFKFSILVKTDVKTSFPVIGFDDTTTDDQIRYLDNTGSIINNGPVFKTCENYGEMYDPETSPAVFIGDNNWNVKRYVPTVDEPDIKAGWTLSREFTISDLSHITKYGEDGNNLVASMYDATQHGVVYSGLLDIRIMECGRGTAYHRQTATFNILLFSAGSIMVQFSSLANLEVQSYIKSSFCPKRDEVTGYTPFSFVVTTVTEIQNGVAPTLRFPVLDVLNYGVDQLQFGMGGGEGGGGGSGSGELDTGSSFGQFRCNAILPPSNPGENQRCLQNWKFIELGVDVNTVYSANITALFSVFYGETDSGQTVSMNIITNIQCTENQQGTHGTLGTMTIYRTRTQTSSGVYNGPSSPPIIVDDVNKNVCIRIDGFHFLTGNSIQQELEITKITVCMSTTSVDFLPYNPGNSIGTGCSTPGTSPLVMDISVYELYRLNGDPFSSQSVCFDASIFVSVSKCVYVQVFFSTRPLVVNEVALGGEENVHVITPAAYLKKKKTSSLISRISGTHSLKKENIFMSQDEFNRFIMFPYMTRRSSIVDTDIEAIFNVLGADLCVRCKTGYIPNVNDNFVHYCAPEETHTPSPSPSPEESPSPSPSPSSSQSPTPSPSSSQSPTPSPSQSPTPSPSSSQSPTPSPSSSRSPTPSPSSSRSPTPSPSSSHSPTPSVPTDPKQKEYNPRFYTLLMFVVIVTSATIITIMLFCKKKRTDRKNENTDIVVQNVSYAQDSSRENLQETTTPVKSTSIASDLYSRLYHRGQTNIN